MSAFVPPKGAVITVGAVIRRADRVLFVRQTYGTMQGMWGLPTGILEAGEVPHHAAQREVREEAGVEATIDGLINITTLTYFNGPMLYLTFLGRHGRGDPTPDGSETDRAAYLSLAEMARGVDGEIEPLCRWLAERALRDDVRVLPPGDIGALTAVFAYHTTYG